MIIGKEGKLDQNPCKGCFIKIKVILALLGGVKVIFLTLGAWMI